MSRATTEDFPIKNARQEHCRAFDFWWRWRERLDDPAQRTEPEGFPPLMRREKRYPKRDLGRIASLLLRQWECSPGVAGPLCRFATAGRDIRN